MLGPARRLSGADAPIRRRWTRRTRFCRFDLWTLDHFDSAVLVSV
ncbi:hypothetical protein RB195_002408 [Necator americanus]|uniref:Uncharacterized protein n=1 Tax=Necator americanus TaxID=51031 RepID=A0ABR1DIW2_NECAM